MQCITAGLGLQSSWIPVYVHLVCTSRLYIVTSIDLVHAHHLYSLMYNPTLNTCLPLMGKHPCILRIWFIFYYAKHYQCLLLHVPSIASIVFPINQQVVGWLIANEHSYKLMLLSCHFLISLVIKLVHPLSTEWTLPSNWGRSPQLVVMHS